MSRGGLFGAIASGLGRVQGKLTDASALTWDRLLGEPRSGAGVSVNVDSALRVSTVFACLRVLSNGIAQVPLRLYREDPNTEEKTLAKDHPVFRLIYRRPNDFMTSFEFRQMMMFHAGLLDVAVAYIGKARGKPKELIPLVPGRFTLQQQKDWTYTARLSDGTELSSDQLFILRGPTWGVAGDLNALHIAREAIGLGIATEMTHSALFANGAQPGGVLSIKGALDEPSRQRLKADWTAYQEGIRNKFRTAVLDMDASWQPFAMTGVDAQHLECMVPGTLVSMADGSRKPVEHVIVGDEVVAWAHGPVRAKVSFVGRPPPKRLIKVTTARGRSITVSSDHPFLALRSLRTAGGRPNDAAPKWLHAGNLKAGNYLRVGLGNVVPQHSAVDFDTAWLLGASVGNGYFRKGAGCSLSITETGVIAKATEVVEHFGGSLVQSTSRQQDFHIRTGGVGRKGGPLRALFNRAGVVGRKAQHKRAPDLILGGGAQAWCGFLSGYLDTDGTVTGLESRNRLVSWSSVSRELLDDCQHMLAMLGVQASIYRVGNGGRRNVCGIECNSLPSWQLVVYGASQLRTLAGLLKPNHAEKRARLAAMADLPASKYRPENFLYDRVKSVEEIGIGETIGIEVEGVHTHVTNGLVTHNTRRFQIEEICRFFNVFPQMIGHTDKTATFASAEAFFLAHVVHTLTPWVENWEQALARDLFPDEDDLFAKFSLQGLLRGDNKTRAEFYASGIVNGWLTRNEARRLEDLNPLDGLDQPLLPLNMGTQAERDALANDVTSAVKAVLGHNGGPPIDDRALELKIGRVLSSANERRIVGARDQLNDVLTTLGD
jgi:phage portal protein BeeE